MTVSTHILDTASGRPAAGIPVLLEIQDTNGNWSELGRGVTDGDGRLGDLVSQSTKPTPATCRLTFDVAAYLQSQGGEVFYPQVSVVFRARAGERYHIPLLLSPYGYSTYRGS